ncbi:hypothetical protein TU84_13475 [Pseudomonas helleri]|nr:hypothetical protein TU84_13475 [Pseudomonas helleri]
MPIFISAINRVSPAVSIGIYSALPKRAEIVWTIETHQHWIKGSMTITQKIMTGHRISAFAIKTK